MGAIKNFVNRENIRSFKPKPLTFKPYIIVTIPKN